MVTEFQLGIRQCSGANVMFVNAAETVHLKIIQMVSMLNVWQFKD